MQYYFDDVNHALTWSTEVLRRRGFPKLSSIYREILTENSPVENVSVKDIGGGNISSKDGKNTEKSGRNCWFGEYGQIPTDSDDRLWLAKKVYGFLAELDEEDVDLLRLYCWGDMNNDKDYQRILRIQKELRNRGVRARISYRYSFRQIGQLLNVDHKTAANRVRKALTKLSKILQRDGFLHVPNFHEEERLAG